MAANMVSRDQLKTQVAFHYEQSGRRLPTFWLLPAAFVASTRAGILIRIITTAPRWIARLCRELLILTAGSDVTPNATVLGPIFVPHPVGIVIGDGVVLHPNVSIYQNVTLGRDGTGRYPVVGAGATLFAGCVVVGGISLGENVRIGANRVVNSDIPSDRDRD